MSTQEIKKAMPNDDVMDNLSNLFKILGDNTRGRILFALRQKVLNVSEICECVDMNKSAVSHQLKSLKQAKLIKSKKIGKEVYYSLDDEHVNLLFDCALEHIMED